MKELLAVASALSDENRVRIVACLRRGELCVCQIVELLGLAPSTTSKHLFLLKHAGLIESRKDGRWMHYRLADGKAAPVVKEALKWLGKSVEGTPRAAADVKRLRGIRKLDPEVLCCRQREGKRC